MDVVLEWADNHGLDKAWESLSPEYTRDNLLRQCVSVSASTTHVACNVYYILSLKRVSCLSQLYTLTIIGIFVLYFGMAGGSYYLMCRSTNSHDQYCIRALYTDHAIHICFFSPFPSQCHAFRPALPAQLWIQKRNYSKSC